ncbi:MAG: AAA family ATPase [Promethearchaeota archaeon]
MSFKKENHLNVLKRNLKSMIRARYPYIWIQTNEEERIMNIIEEIGASLGRQCYVFDEVQLWKSISSWTKRELYNEDDNDDEEELPPGFTADKIISALKDDILSCIEREEKFLLIFPDFHFFIENINEDRTQIIIRIIKWLNAKIRNSYISVIFISNSNVIPSEIEDIMHIEVVRPPEKEELKEILEEILKDFPELKSKIHQNLQEQMISSALGLTLNQAKRLFSLAIATRHKKPSEMVDIIIEGKKGIISSSGALEFFAPNEVPTYLAGLYGLKEWLELRKDAFTEEAEKYRLPKPKGVFLMGIPGTGKSLTAKFIAGTWKMPLLRFDIGAVYGSLVGQTEAAMRQALHIVEAIAPAILWIDEIEKAISTGPDLDSGVSKRVLGTLLTWMQETTAPVFVVATANDTSALPPELMRKGRFDELFFLELPNEEERKEIFEVHLKNVGRDPNNYDIEQLVKKTDKFTGAEIEQVIKEALYIAFSDNRRELDDEDILEAISKTKPLSETKKDIIEALTLMVEKREVRSASKKIRKIKTPKKAKIELE